MLDFNEFTSVTTLGDLLLMPAKSRRDVDALVFPAEGGGYDRLTYGALADRALHVARGLMAMGIKRGDHVGILLPSCIDFVEVFFGIALAGGVAVPINARYRSHELAYVARNSDMRLLVTTTQVAETVNFVERLGQAFPDLAGQGDSAALSLEGAPLLRAMVLLDGKAAPGFLDRARFDAGAAGVTLDSVHERRHAVCVRDPGLILYTSGTTANPKGCLITHEAMVRTGQGLAIRYETVADDRFWSPLPLFHIAAMLPLVAMFSVGGSYLSMQRFDAGLALKMMDGERATMAYPCFAPFIADLMFHPDLPKTDLTRIRMSNSNLAVMTQAVRDAYIKATPNCAHVGSYGLSEATGTVCTHSVRDSFEARSTRLGRPMPGCEIRIARPDGSTCEPGEIGEILVSSFALFEGYYKEPEKSAEALRDGWLHTGDLGEVDSDGFIMFRSRLKDMLKVGGENVAAAEIEAMVALHPAVKACQVVGWPDPRLTEIPVAFVELVPGAAATPEEIVAFCKPRIASFKIPRHIRFVTEWPMSASKIQKFELSKAFAKEMGVAM